MGLFSRSTTFTDPAMHQQEAEFEVNNWIISEFVLEKLVPVVGVRPFPLNELMLLASTVCRFKPDLIFDWGTHIGVSARVFHETITTFGIPAHIHSIDLPDTEDHVEHPRNDRGRLVRGLKTVTLHQGDGVSSAIDLLDKNPGKRALFYVDGDHSYESVKRELGLIIKHPRMAATLLHDTFDQSAGSGYNTGPHRAIQEILATHGSGFRTIKTNTGLPGMTLVYPSAR